MSNDHKPQRKFMGAAGLPSIDLYGPEALKDDLDDINAMFNPNAEHKNGNPGGIGKGNLKFRFDDTDFATGVGSPALPHLGENIVTVAGQLAALDEHVIDLEAKRYYDYVLVITITQNGDTWTADKTFKEIVEYLEDKYYLYVTTGNDLIPFVMANEEGLVFSTMATDESYNTDTITVVIGNTEDIDDSENDYVEVYTYRMNPMVFAFSINEYGHIVYEKTNWVNANFSLSSTGHLLLGVV